MLAAPPLPWALTVLSLMPDANSYDIKILATDIDTKMLAHGRNGVYDANALRQALAERVQRVCVLLPYDRLSLAAVLRDSGTVLKEEYREDGVYLEGIVQTADAHRLAPYLCQP